MDKKKILVVEDEKAIADILVFNLGREGYVMLPEMDVRMRRALGQVERREQIRRWTASRSAAACVRRATFRSSC